jgi:hypothetical protein
LLLRLDHTQTFDAAAHVAELGVLLLDLLVPDQRFAGLAQ